MYRLLLQDCRQNRVNFTAAYFTSNWLSFFFPFHRELNGVLIPFSFGMLSSFELILTGYYQMDSQEEFTKVCLLNDLNS